MHLRSLALAALLVLGCSVAGAQHNGLIVKSSPHGVIETADRLEQILAEKGIDVLARFDHAENARKVDLELAPTELLVFGNPNLGTPLMQKAPTIGIDLPMKVLVFEDDRGEVWLAYNDPGWLATRHAVADEDEIFQKMSGALDQITDGALAE
ncbi:MAG: DUF302 domain-containing protein [Geminicoccaceae bacterium]|nr:DUF302 domain-containing protein [Geminicoccaceae bacterium]